MMGKGYRLVGSGKRGLAGRILGVAGAGCWWFLGVVLAVVMVFCWTVMPVRLVFADDPNCVDTSVIGEAGEDGNTQFCSDGSNGGLVIKLLTDIVDVLTVGVGILGVIGITVVGLQYLTAGGSEEKTRVAKRRMFEIVIGLVAYVAIYAVLKFLLPTFGT